VEATAPITKVFPRTLDDALRAVDKLVVDSHPNKWRVNGYFATLTTFLPFTKQYLKVRKPELALLADIVHTEGVRRVLAVQHAAVRGPRRGPGGQGAHRELGSSARAGGTSSFILSSVVCDPKHRSLCSTLCQIEVYNKRVESETPERVKEGNSLVLSVVVNAFWMKLIAGLDDRCPERQVSGIRPPRASGCPRRVGGQGE
jgi:hypothetical protein